MSCGEEIDFISMGLELEKWKRFSELSIVYSLSKEHGIQIPGEWDLATQSSASGSDPTSGGAVSRTSSTDPQFLRNIDSNISRFFILASDNAGVGGVSNSPTSTSENVGSITPID